MVRSSLFGFLATASLMAVAQVVVLTATVEQVLADPQRYERADWVTVRGTVADFEQHTSRRGNTYFTFKLRDGRNFLNVFSQGNADPRIRNQAIVEVTGKFRKTKTVGDFTVENELDATPVRDGRAAIRILEPPR